MAGWWGAVACLGRGSGERERSSDARAHGRDALRFSGTRSRGRARGPDHARKIAGGDRPPPGACDASGGCRELHPGASPSSVPDRPTRWLRGAGDAAFLSRSP